MPGSLKEWRKMWKQQARTAKGNEAVPPMANEEFNRRFRWHLMHIESPTDLPEPDDGGLFKQTIGTLSRKAA